MIGNSHAFRAAQALIRKFAQFDAPVLVEGETGTGKELAARAIHYGSRRKDAPFVPVNCGALPDHLIENELFGHRRGAFTDARDDQAGLIAMARSGTIFLDEIDSLPLKGQVVLLRFMQDRRYRPLGGREEQKADVRIIAAANQSLEELASRNEFRLDLLHRLKILDMRMPALRERHGDIPLLSEHFLQSGSLRFGKPALPIDSGTLSWFEEYPWPGNIRELENLVHRELLLAEGATVSVPAPACLARAPRESATLNFRHAKSEAIVQFESRFLSTLIAQTKGNVSAAARLSGTERRYLGRLLKKHGILASPDNAATR